LIKYCVVKKFWVQTTPLPITFTDLAPSDFYSFLKLKEYSRTRNDKDVLCMAGRPRSTVVYNSMCAVCNAGTSAYQ